MNAKTILLALAAIAAVGAVAYQIRSTSRLRSELAELRQQINGPAPATNTSVRRERPRGQTTPAPLFVEERLTSLENAVADLKRAADYLALRGQLPLGNAQLQEASRLFSDISARDRDRLQSLRQLRRAGTLSDDMVNQALAWLQSSTNGALRADILNQLEDLTNAVLRAPLLELAARATEPNVREQSIENLQAFVGDPQVEAQLWRSLLNDPDPDVREEAADALVDGPMTEARLAALQQRALSSDSSLEEKLVAMRALNQANVMLPQLTAALAELAQTTADINMRLRLFEEFEDMNDPTLRVPLINGLRDENPRIREGALEALEDYLDDPQVEQWVRYLAENDPDPVLRREAFEVLNDD